jgi:hypothetical protein
MIVASVLLTLTFALAANGIETFHGCVAIAANASDVFVPLSVPRTESSFVVAFVVTPVFTNALPSNTFVAYQWVDTMPMTGAMSTAGPCVTTPPLGKLSSPLQSGIPRSFLWIQRPQLVRQFSNAIDVYFTLVTWPEEVEQVVRGTATVVTGPQTPLGMSVTANTIALFSYSRDGENFDDDDWGRRFAARQPGTACSHAQLRANARARCVSAAAIQKCGCHRDEFHIGCWRQHAAKIGPSSPSAHS